jgi:rRNA maturation endonuclease Nob1
MQELTKNFMIKKCVLCGSEYNFKESKTEECWVCGAPLEEIEREEQKDEF